MKIALVCCWPGILIAESAKLSETTNQYEYVDAINVQSMRRKVDSAQPIIVAIIDDAFNTSHRELKPFFLANPLELPDNGLDDDNNGYVDDYLGWDVADEDPDVRSPIARIGELQHGTRLTGIVFRIINAALGSDASRLVHILPVKTVSDHAPSGQLVHAFKGIEYALDANADIILTSWGIGQISPKEQRLLERADSQGAIIVASAGNERIEKVQYPAAHRSVIAVAAIDENGRPLIKSNHGSFVDLSAPGKAIMSTGYSASSRDAQSGTSYSAAMVAAAAALVKLANPDLSSEEISACLVNHTGALSIENQAKLGKFGSGILNVGEAVDCLSIRSPDYQLDSTKPNGYLVVDESVSEKFWKIDPEGQYKGMRITHLSSQAADEYGTLQLSETSNNVNAARSFQLTGSPQVMSVPENLSYLRFSNARQNSERSLLHYEMITTDFTKEYCSGTSLIDVESSIEDGSGDSPYSYYSECKWLIVAPEDKVIEFKVVELDTEPNIDKIYFFDGEETNGSIMAEFSGSVHPPKFRSWRNKALVWFLSNEENEFAGWKIDLKFVDK